MLPNRTGPIYSVAIVGVGSPIEDDTLGWRAAEWLERSVLRSHFPDIRLTFAQSDRPGALLLEQLRGYDGGIIIDAMNSGLPPGVVRQFTPEQLTRENSLLSSHGFGVAEALALGRSLAPAPGTAAVPNRLSVIGIEMGKGKVADSWQIHLPVVINKTLSEWVTTEDSR
jgi:hydrogenase maturation protease